MNEGVEVARLLGAAVWQVEYSGLVVTLLARPSLEALSLIFMYAQETSCERSGPFAYPPPDEDS